MDLKKIGILYHPMKEKALVLSEELSQWLKSRGLSSWLCSAWEEDQARAQLDNTDLLLTVGGDGTILRAAQIALPIAIPITGINMGKVGFMTEIGAGEVKERLPLLLGKDAWLDDRSMIEVQVLADASARVYHCLNDLVVARGGIARLISVETRVNDELLAHYRVDGIIITTATGSTGYALAAGGPVLPPQMDAMALVPISPHLCANFNLVLPSSAVIKLRVNTTHQATFSIDGIINLPLANGTELVVRHSPRITRFRRIRRGGFYGNLERKLKGRED